MDLRSTEHLLHALEVLSVIVPSFFLTVISTNLSSAFVARPNKTTKYLLLDFVVLVLPVILGTTIWSNHSTIVILSTIGLAALLTLSNKKQIESKIKDNGDGDNQSEKTSSTTIYYLSSTRSIINLITVVCILAVDFHVFPWRFRKTKRYGISLMDVGVGLYVVANGIVACEIRGITHSIRKTFINVLPILVIGVLRFVCTYATHYRVDPHEYGVHWNFFITLAVTKLLSAVLLTFVTPSFASCLCIGLFVMAVHQSLLWLGLEQFVFSDIERDNLLTANREGIVSSLGYVGLYFMSVATGFIIWTFKSKQRTLSALLCGTVLLVIATCVLHELFNISRCLANSTYIAWILLIAYFMIFLLCAHEQFLSYFYSNRAGLVYSPLLYEAINYNGLTYFLIANLLTGFVNLSMKTSDVGKEAALAILCAYMLTCSCIVVFLYVKKFKLKL